MTERDPDLDQSTPYLWALLFRWVDVELELRRLGRMREAVVIRQRNRSIGRLIMSRYENISAD